MGVRLPAAARTWGARRALRRERRRADAELVATRLPSPRLAWRVRELVADSNRLALARSLTGTVHSVDERFLPSASPLDRGAARACRPELLALASRVCDLDRPVTARGVLFLQALLVDSSGPLYGRNDPGQLRRAVERVRTVLEGADDPGI